MTAEVLAYAQIPHASLSWHEVAMTAFKTIGLGFLSLFSTLAATRAQNIVLTNDDGWAEINARTLFNSLAAAGNDVVLSGPAENQSGTGMSA